MAFKPGDRVRSTIDGRLATVTRLLRYGEELVVRFDSHPDIDRANMDPSKFEPLPSATVVSRTHQFDVGDYVTWVDVTGAPQSGAVLEVRGTRCKVQFDGEDDYREIDASVLRKETNLLKGTAPMRHHTIKLAPGLFRAIRDAGKRFTVQSDDRMYQCGDTVTIEFAHPSNPAPSLSDDILSPMDFRIGFVLRGGQYGIEHGYVAFQLDNTERTV